MLLLFVNPELVDHEKKQEIFLQGVKRVVDCCFSRV